jgi:hypothetical protein
MLGVNAPEGMVNMGGSVGPVPADGHWPCGQSYLVLPGPTVRAATQAARIAVVRTGPGADGQLASVRVPPVGSWRPQHVGTIRGGPAPRRRRENHRPGEWSAAALRLRPTRWGSASRHSATDTDCGRRQVPRCPVITACSLRAARGFTTHTGGTGVGRRSEDFRPRRAVSNGTLLLVRTGPIGAGRRPACLAANHRGSGTLACGGAGRTVGSGHPLHGVLTRCRYP